MQIGTVGGTVELAVAVIYAFGEFELDAALLELRWRGGPKLVPPRVLTALLHLVQNRARSVTRDELAAAVWNGLAVSDAAVSQTIMLARKATHDEGDQQNVIKTLRGHGFRFVASVREVEHGLQPTAAASAAPEQPHPALFGRTGELTALLAHLDSAERGRGALVLIQGAPGIGKTTLIEAFAARATARGAHVFLGPLVGGRRGARVLALRPGAARDPRSLRQRGDALMARRSLWRALGTRPRARTRRRAGGRRLPRQRGADAVSDL